MAISLKRDYPLHLKHRYRHILRLLLRDLRFVSSVIGLVIVAALISLIIIRAPQIRQTTAKLVESSALALASSGTYTGWHSYADHLDRFRASFPCFAYTVPQPGSIVTPLGTLPAHSTACLYDVRYTSGGQPSISEDNFWIRAAAVHYPADQAGQVAFLQEIAGGNSASTLATTLHDLPTFVQQNQDSPGPGGAGSPTETYSTYYVLGNGNLYVIITSHRPDSPDYTNRFVSSFQPLK